MIILRYQNEHIQSYTMFSAIHRKNTRILIKSSRPLYFTATLPSSRFDSRDLTTLLSLLTDRVLKYSVTSATQESTSSKKLGLSSSSSHLHRVVGTCKIRIFPCLEGEFDSKCRGHPCTTKRRTPYRME